MIKSILLWFLGAIVLGSVYLLYSMLDSGNLGFPLDDAWIHQTYARNLADSGQLAFVPGAPSAGSTSPLWSLLLGIGYLLNVPFKLWTYGLGLLFLALIAWTASRLAKLLFPKQRNLDLWIGLFCLAEWHHLWVAVSGMETILFIWLSLFLVERYLALTLQVAPILFKPRYLVGLGVLAGLLTLTRPEGLGLIGLIGLDVAIRVNKGQMRQFWRNWFWLVVGLGLLLLPYIGLHLWLTGHPFPNTLYAKQAEYGAILQTYPLWWRLFGNFGPTIDSVQGVFRVILIGPQLLLLPGLVWAGWLTIRERKTELFLIWAWWISFLILYAIRLPVTYQHGRYQIPAIVWLVLLGLWGTHHVLAQKWQTKQARFLGRIGQRVVGLSLFLLVIGFIGLGAQAYQRDVRFIETEMVAVAHWIDQNTQPNSLIAAHDIGAIGYFAQRPLIDLAGLITPEVIPFIRDESALFDYILIKEADYLVTFPMWYPNMVQNKRLTIQFETNGEITNDPMTVYSIGEE